MMRTGKATKVCVVTLPSFLLLANTEHLCGVLSQSAMPPQGRASTQGAQKQLSRWCDPSRKKVCEDQGDAAPTPWPARTPAQQGIPLNPTFQMRKLRFVQSLQPGSSAWGLSGVRLVPEGFFLWCKGWKPGERAAFCT